VPGDSSAADDPSVDYPSVGTPRMLKPPST
jgi:hypothetical protein